MLGDLLARRRRALALRLCPDLGTELQERREELRDMAHEVAAQRAAAGIAQKAAQANEDLRQRLAEVERDAQQLRDWWKVDREELERRIDEGQRLYHRVVAAQVERDAARAENRRLRPLDRENRDLWRWLRAARQYVVDAGCKPETLAKLDALLAGAPADPERCEVLEGATVALCKSGRIIAAAVEAREIDGVAITDHLRRCVFAPAPREAPPVLGLPLCTCVTGRCSIHDAIAAPPPADRAPNMKRHRWSSAQHVDRHCFDCNALWSEPAAYSPCPGRKEAAGA